MTGLAAAERQRCTAERLRILTADPAALNTWEQQVLGALAPLGPTEALPAEAFMRQAGYTIKRCFGEMVDRLEHAQFLERRGPGWFALTERGRSALRGAQAKRLQLHRRHWLTPAESTILARLATASGAGWVQLDDVRATLELPADHTYRTIQQLGVAGYVAREYRAIRITDAGRHALI